MRILLADDHTLVRAGILSLVERLPNVTEVIEAADGEEAVAAATAYRPDVILMDLTMPRMNGFEATSRILKKFPNTRIIILSVHRGEEFVFRAFRTGASGYLVKAAAVTELQKALRAIEEGQRYVSSSLDASVAQFPE